MKEAVVNTVPAQSTVNKSTVSKSTVNKSTATQSIATHTIDTAISNHQALPTSDEANTVRTTCPYCGVGCGVLAQVDDRGVVSVKGDPEHPANFGKLCSKGSTLAQTLGTQRRLTQPYYQDKQASMQQQQSLSPNAFFSNNVSPNTSSPNNLSSRTSPHIESKKTPDASLITENTDWDTVLDDIAKRLNDTIAKHGRDSVMFYVSGQLLTEDYYVANKFIKGFIGNNNIDSNSRLCMSSAVAGHKRAFGADLVPGNYEDLEACDLLVLVGSNMAWCHPILFGRFLAAKKRDPNKKLVVIDPRRTDSCEFADLHLPIAAGTDTHLYNGLLHYLEQHGCQDKTYTSQSIGVDAALMAAKPWTIDKVASACQVPSNLICQFYDLVAKNDKTVTAFSMGVNQSKSGTDKVNAIINTHLFTGRVGKVGASPFSLTGQPNAMGGREVGALANLLAAHLDLDSADHRQLVTDFWASPQPISPNVGIKACDAADAILDGRIKAIWIMATNPVVSLPEADKFRQALAECDLVIVSDCSIDSDTLKCADIVLPAQGWGEKSGTVTNSERRISRQRSFMPAVGAAKPDWWILSQVAKRLGLAGFDYQYPSEIFNEHVALTAYGNARSQPLSSKNQPRYFNLANDLSEVIAEPAHTGQSIDPLPKSSELSREQYEAMLPFQWGGTRISMVQIPDKGAKRKALKPISCTKAQLIAIMPIDDASMPNYYRRRQSVKGQPVRTNQLLSNPASRLLSQVDKDIASIGNDPALDLRLITGRLRDQWHTMTRTGLAPSLNQHQSVPALTLHPKDAKQLGVATDDFVQLYRQYEKGVPVDEEPSKVLAQVVINDAMRTGDAFMPMHWSNAFASFARVGTLIPTAVDPHSGQPELKNSAIRVSAVPMQTVGKILVHPDWQDAVIVQLRTILDRFAVKMAPQASLKPRSVNSWPALTWNMSRQTNSISINFASPNAEVCTTLNTPDFWQQLVDSVRSSLPAAQASTIHTAFTTNQPCDQLRFIVTEVVPMIATQNGANGSAIAYKEEADERLIMAVYLAPTFQGLPSIHWLDSCFADTSQIPSSQRYKWLLAGRPASGYVDPGVLVCSCMSVGENIIIRAITQDGCKSATAVGVKCKAGTNCGSCVSQINDLITKHAQFEDA
ncbi:nitrate reductase [Psychrobacter sp. B38]|uniref:nitrate reductase n=1 Tax=Psychrobacter sp. B38 TaxID=3143538 RepID=UPI00321041BD